MSTNRREGRRYTTPAGPEAEFQPGSRGRVLCNLLDITSKKVLLIHPFRDGNGRLARWIADLMALQAGLPAPKHEFEGREQKARREAYLAAVTRAYGQDYDALTDFFADAIEARLSEGR